MTLRCDCCGDKRDINERFHHCFKCHKAGCESISFNGRKVKRCVKDDEKQPEPGERL